MADNKGDSLIKYLQEENEKLSRTDASPEDEIQAKLHRLLSLKVQREEIGVQIELAKLKNIKTEGILSVISLALQWEQLTMTDSRERDKMRLQNHQFNKDFKLRQFVAVSQDTHAKEQDAQRWRQLEQEDQRLALQEKQADRQDALQWAEHQLRAFQAHGSEHRQDALAQNQIRDSEFKRLIEGDRYNREREKDGERRAFRTGRMRLP